MLHKNGIIILILLGLWDFQNKIRCSCTIQGKYREVYALGRVFNTAVFSMHGHQSCPRCGKLTSRCPEAFDKSPVSFFFFFFFSCTGRFSSWKLMPQPGKAKHMEVSRFADRKPSGDQRSSTRLGLKPGLQPTFPDLWGSAKPTKTPLSFYMHIIFLLLLRLLSKGPKAPWTWFLQCIFSWLASRSSEASGIALVEICGNNNAAACAVHVNIVTTLLCQLPGALG